ncbi:hypothetical protein [Luedemannella helvata]|uniref:Integral membrane protein n=1 Tax=Luedemannella helvata TaxID=349315 RepID=A0ABP4VRX6_9ACTN
MTPALATGILITSLVLAGWALVAALRERWLNRGHLALAAVIEVAVLAQVVIALVRMAGGEKAAEPATFIGYLLTVALLLPAATVLAYMEQTRWGSVIMAVAGAVVAVLMLRLQQVW